MALYLLLCFMGIVAYVAIIGWRKLYRWDNIAFFYLLCFSITYFIRPWYIFETKFFRHFYNLQVTPFQDWWSVEWLAVKMGLAIILGLSAFAWAFQKVAFRSKAMNSDAARNKVWTASPALRKRLVVLSLILGGLAIACILIYRPLPMIRDISSAEMDKVYGGGFGFSSTTGYTALAERFIIPACVLLFFSTGNLWYSLFLSIPFILLRLWSGIGRASLLQLAISIFLSVKLAPIINKRRGKTYLFIVLLFIMGVAAVFGVLGKERTAFQSFLYEGKGPVLDYWETTYDKYLADLVGFEISLHWLEYAPGCFPYQWGANYGYQFFILPIPRRLWPEKRNIFAIPENLEAGNTLYLLGCAPGCIGDAWLNGGWIGIAVLFALTGAFCGWVQKMRGSLSCPLTGLFIFVTVYPLAVTLVRDGLSAISTNLYFIGIPALATYLLERHFSIIQTRKKYNRYAAKTFDVMEK